MPINHQEVTQAQRAQLFSAPELRRRKELQCHPCEFSIGLGKRFTNQPACRVMEHQVSAGDLSQDDKMAELPVEYTRSAQLT